MASIKADGNKLIDCGEDIVRLSNEYLEAIGDLFNKLSSISKVAWSGVSADSYVAKVMSEKRQYINFGNYLKSYGNVIKNTGENINYIIKKWDDK